MENLKSVENAVSMGVPVGYRFDPTDNELIVHYLRRKVMSLPMPSYTIPEFDVYKSDTWDLTGTDSEGTRYFFSKNEPSYPNGDIPNSSGYWKPTGIDSPIRLTNGKHVIVAMKKILFYYRGKSPNGFQTNWIMHEFRLHAYAADKDGSFVNPNKRIKLSESSDGASVSMDKYWVLTKVFRKKNETKKAVRPRFFSDPPAASGSSGKVEISPTHEPDREEETTTSNKKP